MNAQFWLVSTDKSSIYKVVINVDILMGSVVTTYKGLVWCILVFHIKHKKLGTIIVKVKFSVRNHLYSILQDVYSVYTL